MNCPECNSENTLYMHEDPIPCTDCDSTVVVGYFMCTECNYSFRTANGKFLDGSYPAEVEQLLNDLMDELNGSCSDHMCGGCSGCDTESMMDTICNCARCGRPMLFSPNTTEYSCPYCGFEWEVLEGE